MTDCEHNSPKFRGRAGDERNEAECRILSKVREILETPEGECVLCHAQHIKNGYDFWYAGPPAIANRGRFAEIKGGRS